jgi:predicted nucleic acid-binding protein
LYALVNSRDEWHEEAVRWRQRLAGERRKLVTTELIVVEIADGLALIRFRAQAVDVITALQSSPLVQLLSLTSGLLTDAIDMYSHRSDKDWG